MTIISSGNSLALQDAGTNPSTTVTNKLYDNTMVSGADALLGFERLYELSGGDNFASYTEWQGDNYGYTNNFFTATVSGNPIMGFLGNAGASGAFPIGNFRSFSQSSLGLLSQTTFSDTSGTTRTIKAITWGQPDGAPSPNSNVEWFIFALSGTGISNSDNTFKSIKITKPSGSQQTFTRSTATRFSNSTNGCTAWAWEYSGSGTNVDNLGTSGSNWDVEIYGSDVTTTLNNGIAEEMGGADSADVKLSDYYSGGTFTGSISGVPTSGEIKFSDFYGKTFASSSIHAFGFTSAGVITTQIYTNVYSYQSGYNLGLGATQSGVITDGTFPNSGSITFGGSTRTANSVQVYGLYNFGYNNSSTGSFIQFVLRDSSGGTFQDSGWSTLKIWLGQTNGSGSPDLTLNRSDRSSFYANTIGSTTQGTWTFNASRAFSSYFGTTATSHYAEIN